MFATNYSYVSKIYNDLMRDVNYEAWAEYLTNIYNKYGNEGTNFLEIAGGNGLLSSILKSRFSKLILTDKSYHMLQESDYNMKVCCDMKAIPFKSKFDFIFSTFDSINYLLSKKDLLIHFNEIYKILADDGIYTFDVSLEANSLNNIQYLNRSGKSGNYSFKQISNFNKKTRIHSNKFEFYENNEIILQEIHLQKVYSLSTFFEIINKSKMFAVECFDSFSFKDANSKSERAQFIIKKIKHDKPN